jgi:hypothetical protein
MKTSTNKFTIHLFVYTAIIGAIAYGLTFIMPANYFSPLLPMLFPFFLAATAIVFFYLAKSSERKINSYINRFMLVTFLKLMIYMAVLLTYVFTHKEDAVNFIISFFILYVAYTAFEVLEMLRFSKGQKS